MFIIRAIFIMLMKYVYSKHYATLLRHIKNQTKALKNKFYAR